MADIRFEDALRFAQREHTAGNLQQAEAIYRRLLSHAPNQPYVLRGLGILAWQHGRHAEGAELLRRALSIHSADPDIHATLSMILLSLNEPAEAMAAAENAIRLDPKHANAHCNRGFALKQLKRTDEAIESLREAARHRPSHLTALLNLGILLRDAGRAEEAMKVFLQALHHHPRVAALHNNLGTALGDLEKIDEAIIAHRRAIDLDPNDAAGFTNLSLLLKQRGMKDEALSAAQAAARISPGLFPVHNNLGTILLWLGQLDQAENAFREALRLAPDHPVLMNNLANVLRDQGEIDEAIALYRGAIRQMPSSRECHSNLLFSLSYHGSATPQDVLHEHLAWNQRHAQPLAAEIAPHANDRDPDRPLRVGFVSADFRDHPVARFFRPILEHRDRQTLQPVCFSATTSTDAVTGALRKAADEWHDVAALNEQALAELVRHQRIDILVDLSLHSEGNRLLTFARKPAPVQVSYLGYPGTTGLSAIDYRLTDPYLDPPGSDAFYAEKSIRLPSTYWCYSSPVFSEPVGPLPVERAGFITFGSLNKFAKVSRQCLKTWVDLLREVANARLAIFCNPGQHRQKVLSQFLQAGIGSERIEFLANQPYDKYLSTYQRIDIALDSFPYCGGTTTCDATWMGVPTVTLAGKLAVHRSGVSILSNVGLPEMIAETPARYIEIAAERARDLPGLRKIRAGLRGQMQASPLMNGAQFARDLESALRSMWRASLPH